MVTPCTMSLGGESGGYKKSNPHIENTAMRHKRGGWIQSDRDFRATRTGRENKRTEKRRESYILGRLRQRPIKAQDDGAQARGRAGGDWFILKIPGCDEGDDVYHRERSQCKECGGSSICQHLRRMSTCKECGGGSICQHLRQRSQCADDDVRSNAPMRFCAGNSLCQRLRLGAAGESASSLVISWSDAKPLPQRPAARVLGG